MYSKTINYYYLEVLDDNLFPALFENSFDLQEGNSVQIIEI